MFSNEFCLGNSFPRLRKCPNGVKFKQGLRAIPISIWNHKFHMLSYIQGADKVLGQLKIYIIHLIVNKNR